MPLGGPTKSPEVNSRDGVPSSSLTNKVSSDVLVKRDEETQEVSPKNLYFFNLTRYPVKKILCLNHFTLLIRHTQRRRENQ